MGTYERAECGEAFGCHGEIVGEGTDKMNESESRLMGNSLEWT